MAIKLNILLVEDDEANIAAARQQLANHDLTVLESYDQAHYLLQNQPVVIDGDRAAELMRQRLPDGYTLAAVNPSPYRPFDWELDIRDSSGQRVRAWLADPFGPIWKQVQIEAAVQFDVVLTDVMLPNRAKSVLNWKGKQRAEEQGPMPYGPVVALLALQKGVKRVGILTQGDHHTDPVVMAFDHLGAFSLGDVKVVASNHCARQLEDGSRVKDWEKLLIQLLAD